MEADFSGYATKAGLKCSDGRTITRDAFAHQDKVKVPLVWQHAHNEPTNVLGHAILESREDGVYCYGYFNDSEQGKNAKTLVEHGDITALSIYANQLVEKAKAVLHGAIREVSLVLSGANPGALIDQVRLAHSDGEIETLEDEAIIYTGLVLEHSEPAPEPVEEPEPVVEPEPTETEPAEEPEPVQHADNPDGETVQEVYDSLNDKQKDVVHFMIGAALEGADNGSAAQHSDTITEGDLTHQEGNDNMSRNVFDGNGTKTEGPTLSHAQIKTIFDDAQKMGSFKESFLAHADEYGITDIDMLFPDAKNVTTTPEFISRRMEWVAKVLDGAKHSPFSRIKSVHADITAEEARAKGYVKGNLKKDEVIKLLKRVTTPTTVYKKQKLDRDDIVDITDFDVVVWLKGEMRLMLEEELARAILIGDGREPDDDDKIDEEKIRPIAWDNEMYAHPVTVPANISPDGIIESVLRARKHYKGTGRPTFFTTDDILTDMILIKDKVGRRLYNTEAELAAALRVTEIVVVEVMEDTPDLLGVIVNMADYTIGADRGGQLAMFDDFDIDYNQQKYLLETRVSGALTKAKSAVVIKRTSGTTVTPAAPAFDEETNTITVPNTAGVKYFDVTNPLDDTELAAGAVVITQTTDVEARPNAGYNFPHNTDADWTFAYTA
jgi:HK97 family phage prohead protease